MKSSSFREAVKPLCTKAEHKIRIKQVQDRLKAFRPVALCGPMIGHSDRTVFAVARWSHKDSWLLTFESSTRVMRRLEVNQAQLVRELDIRLTRGWTLVTTQRRKSK